MTFTLIMSREGRFLSTSIVADFALVRLEAEVRPQMYYYIFFTTTFKLTTNERTLPRPPRVWIAKIRRLLAILLATFNKLLKHVLCNFLSVIENSTNTWLR